MAWEGRSASEIADELGVCVQYVYQLCTDYRITLAKKSKSQYAFRVTLQLKTIARLEKLAAERGESVDDMTARMIDALSHEKTLLANLLDESDDEPKRKQRQNPRKPVTNTRVDDRDDD